MHGKRSKVVCLVNKSCWVQVMNAMTSKVKWQWRVYYTNGPDDQTFDDDDWLCTITVKSGY